MTRRPRKLIKEKLNESFCFSGSLVNLLHKVRILIEELNKKYEDKYFDYDCILYRGFFGLRYETDEEYEKRCSRLDKNKAARAANRIKKDRLKGMKLKEALKLYKGNTKKLLEDMKNL